MTAITSAAIDMSALEQSAITHLQTLLRINTSNPPGNETAAAEYIATVCREAGIEVEVVESAPGRGNVSARLRSANATERPLMLTGHNDVVTIEADKWTSDPFGGELRDGYIWGRGALDMKSMVAAELAVLLALKESGVALDRDIILAVFADEETGGEFGATWMWDNRRDLVDAEYAINEGGGVPIQLNGQTFYLLQAGEKGASRLRITARATPGHASVPLDDTAMGRIGQALAKLHAWQSPTVLTDPVRRMLEAVAPALGPRADSVRQVLDASDGALTWDDIAALRLPFDEDTMLMLRATTRNTAVPTIIHGGHRINVIPSEIVLDVDGRILPGADPDEWRDAVQAVVGDTVEVELLSRETGIMADPASPLFEAIEASIDALDPGAKVAPTLCTGGTDARNLPGIKVYGFFPFPLSPRITEYSPLIHGHDERIHVDDLTFGTRFLYDVVVRFAGQ